MKKIIMNILNRLGFEIRRFPAPDIASGENADIINKVMHYTMTSYERVSALCDAVKYVVAEDIPGDIVECGVWKGGSMLAVALMLVKLKNQTRGLYLFDTFDGMTTPSEDDVYSNGRPAALLLKQGHKKNPGSAWCCVGLEEVKKVMSLSAYDKSKIHFVKGRIEDTVPDLAPRTISILRLDTDFYESTVHELKHLFNRISQGGILIIDDYGSWQGVRKAVDEFIERNDIRIFLNRIDYSSRFGVVTKDRP
ncbi:MAG: macrocin O-methyltransferase [Candidatus Omnitrophica bacterium]|nr:macrocin O-methyltransferase [Candidatus Omnitrophota bacterium]MDD5660348.1 macrocin O-methyltransferase [Candidatus Omnitrophota bacterium]